MRVLIDPGHGGTDAGCEYFGVREKDLALSLAEQLAAAWPNEVALTRRGDETRGLAARGHCGANCDAQVTLCLHINACTDPRVGYLSAFHLAQDKDAADIATAILQASPKALVPRKEPLTALRSDWTARAYNVLHPHLGRRPVLVEAGFLSNPKQAEYLQTWAGQQAVVSALVAGLRRADNLLKGGGA